MLIVVSDHDQLTVEHGQPVALQPAIDRIAEVIGEIPGVVVEGDAAVLTLPNRSAAQSDPSVFDDLPGIEGRLRLSRNDHLVWAPRGRVLSLGSSPAPQQRGVSGGPYARSQVAVIAGGHPTVPVLRDAVGRRAVRGADWAPTMSSLLDVPLTTATGFPLIEPGALRELRASARRAPGPGRAW